jgi:mRNA (guanine-N7-)-methyltransferase
MEINSEFYDNLVNLVSVFNKNKSFELEAKCKQRLSSQDFSNVVKYLRSTGFDETIQEETLDISTKRKDGTYRISLPGKHNIAQYCKSNTVPQSSFDSVTVISKRTVPGIRPLVFDQVGFKIDLRDEQPVEEMKKVEIISELNNVDKGFRLKKRFSYVDSSNTLRVDMTIVKSSRFIGNEFIMYKTFVESGVSTSPEQYEIEVELIKRSSKEAKKIAKTMILTVVELYSVLSNDEHVIPQQEKLNVLTNYMNLAFAKSTMHKGKFDVQRAMADARNKPKQYFAGPQPVTLEQKNIIEDDLGVVTIRKDYTVTEKADGERMLLFVNSDGKCYFINNRLDVKYTAVKLSSIVNTLIDGELISKDVSGNNIKLYAAFDIYWDNSTDVRALPLVSTDKKAKTRELAMKTFVAKTKERFASHDIDMRMKEFRFGEDMFADCKHILDQNVLGKYEYHIDGLIFTPQHLPVGGSYKDDVPDTTGTWNKVFKWKPPSENTIDFLVIAKQSDFTIDNDKNKFKVLNMFVGYNPIQWEPISPRAALENRLNRNPTYIAKKFIPGDVLDDTFSQCYMPIDKESDKIFCINGDEITTNSVVEFMYDDLNTDVPYPLRWKPLRVRQDKTDALRKYGLSGTANDYGTAINIWRSIRFPVTQAMISGKDTVNAKDIVQDDVYYYRTTSRDKFASKPMLDFHNYWIKNKMLISRFAGKDSLFDISCGKGGDVPKWVDHGFTKVLGVDISRDNIENPVDGAYARTIKYNKPNYVYATLDSSVRFTKDYFDTLASDDDRVLCNNLWGYAKSESLAKYQGFAKDKFNVVSCQFSIHYFFENESKLDNFLWNVNEHIKDGGYFIGTCLDGERVRQKLKDVPKGESISGKKSDRTLWYIKKSYDDTGEIKFGDVIDVYMESIGKIIQEYLVNFDILRKKLEAHDIVMLTKDELDALHLDSSFEGFDKSFARVKHSGTDNAHFIDSILKMTKEEQEYSFMNMWFVFVKRGNVNKPSPPPSAEKKKVVKKKT